MQQRFCTCGNAVWVEYRFRGKGCRHRFWSSRFGPKVPLTRCPFCGARIDIDELH